jgi:hypothetical protein
MEPDVSEERGGMPHDGEEDFGLDALERVLADLRAVAVRPAAPDVVADHLARMESAARSAAVPSAAPARSRRRAGAADSFWTMPRRIAAGAAAAFVALFGLGGLGLAGALPGPVQDFVATVTQPLGIDMPRSDDPPAHGKGAESPSPTTGPAVSGAPGQTGATPGQSGETPANGSEPPGQAGTTPGQSGTAPGQSGNPSVTAPGQSGQSPSATAPGQSDNPSATAPGQVANPSATAPRQSGNNGNGGGNANANGSGNGKSG